MSIVISTKLGHEDYKRLKKAFTKYECTCYRFVQTAVIDKLDQQSEAWTTEDRFGKDIHAIKTTILSYARIDPDTRCKNCGEPWVEHDLETMIGLVKDAARDRLSPCKNCGKPLVEHDFDTILWALHTIDMKALGTSDER